MGYVIVIFGSLIALNWGFGYWLSEENRKDNVEGVVEVEQVPAIDDEEQEGLRNKKSDANSEHQR